MSLSAPQVAHSRDMCRPLITPFILRSRSFVHTRPPSPSSAYLDRTSGPDISTSSTPDDLSPSQRRGLEAALRVDQAGEVAANYIYEGQLAILRRDPVASALIQASSTRLLVRRQINILILISGYVGPREKAPRCHE